VQNNRCRPERERQGFTAEGGDATWFTAEPFDKPFDKLTALSKAEGLRPGGGGAT
jgi:hypothetical protein